MGLVEEEGMYVGVCVSPRGDGKEQRDTVGWSEAFRKHGLQVDYSLLRVLAGRPLIFLPQSALVRRGGPRYRASVRVRVMFGLGYNHK